MYIQDKFNVRYIITALIVIILLETVYIVYLSIDRGTKVEPILKEKPPSKGLDIYEDLKYLGCEIYKRENPYKKSYHMFKDYHAFLILAEDKIVETCQYYEFSWEPLHLESKERIQLFCETDYGIVGWRFNFTRHDFITVSNFSQRAVYLEMLETKRMFVEKHSWFGDKYHLSEIDALHLASYFLQDLGYKTGKSGYSKLEIKKPNYYWHERQGIEKPVNIESLDCWVIRYGVEDDEDVDVAEVWIDPYSGKIVGGEGI